jgi:DNA polymerase-3 subunit delta'
VSGEHVLGPALAAELSSGPTHAYLLTGPAGSGKRAAARAFAAELLADGAADPDHARARALADPSPHPDLEWVRPPGNQHLVSEIRERVIAAVPYTPFEAARRVFVIEGADALAEESQNALLTTLEEPPGHAHLILISADPAAILPTIRSRCRAIGFAAPGEDALVARLAEQVPGTGEDELRAAVRLSGGDAEAAGFLIGETGRRLRAAAESCARPGVMNAGDKPWLEMIELAGDQAERVGETVAARAGEAADAAPDEAIAARIRREGEEAAKRAVRRERTRVLMLALRVWAARLRDIEAAAAGSGRLLAADHTAKGFFRSQGLAGADVRRRRNPQRRLRLLPRLGPERERSRDALGRDRSRPHAPAGSPARRPAGRQRRADRLQLPQRGLRRLGLQCRR